MELFLFSRTLQSSGRAFTVGDYLCHIIKVTSPYFTLMFRRGVTDRLNLKLSLLQFGIGCHSMLLVATGELKHAVVQCVEPSQSNKLKLIAHCTEFALELRDSPAVELLLPIERRRTIIGQKFVRKFLAKSLRKTLGLFQVRLARLAPDKIRERRIAQSPSDGLVEACFDAQDSL